jgi:hypothetical protein
VRAGREQLSCLFHVAGSMVSVVCGQQVHYVCQKLSMLFSLCLTQECRLACVCMGPLACCALLQRQTCHV